LLACVSIFALDRALVSYMEGRARERLMALANGALGLAEARLEQATTVLVDIAASGLPDCEARAIDAMRRAVFTNSLLKGLAVLEEDGRAVCTHVGLMGGSYALSREYPLPSKRLTLAVARFREVADRAVRIRLDRPGSRAMAAVVSVDVLLPEIDLGEGTGGKRLRLMFESGEMIAARPSGDEGSGLDGGQSLTVRQQSSRFPLVLIAEHSRSALASEYRDLQFIVRAAMLMLLGLCLGPVALSFTRRQVDPVDDLRRALRDGEIVPYYQPTVDTRNGRIRGAEVLARWRKPDGTLIPPAQFIPLAEQSGLIFDLTRVMMTRAREDVGHVYAARAHLRLGFNLFAGHLADNKIVDEVKKIFSGSKVPPEQLVLEVTERAPLPDLDEARRVISGLQGLGAKVAIDDVGTGHGGLSYLLKLGVDVIKIDKMFVDAIGTERYSQTIIETLVELARTMNMEVIAEGVERIEQVEYLRRKGVYEAQGYAFAPPLPAAAYLGLVEAMDRPGPRTFAEPGLAANAA
jgi:sensor c-di-GMP phosphodiesterase-like protein